MSSKQQFIVWAKGDHCPERQSSLFEMCVPASDHAAGLGVGPLQSGTWILSFGFFGVVSVLGIVSPNFSRCLGAVVG